MTKVELLGIISRGENYQTEFVRDDLRFNRLAKIGVAFANHKGGRILLGVDDDGTITGIQRDDVERWVMDTVFRRTVHPMILPFYEEIQVDDQHRVAVISISQGTTKPYVVRHHGREDIYIRVGSTSQLATREQQARLFAIGGKKGAGILRAKPNIYWKKDRGKEPTRPEEQFPWFWANARFTSERLNDVQLTIAEKRAARQRAEATQ